MKIYNVPESHFNALNGPWQLIAHDHAHRFAVLELRERGTAFGLSWRSDTIEPVVEASGDGSAVWVGVDQHLAVIETRSERICLSLPLNSNLLQLAIKENVVVVLTEGEVILFNVDFSIRFIKGLPDLPDTVSIEDQRVTIRLVDGGVLRFHRGTGLPI